jgi:hypothetical protein
MGEQAVQAINRVNQWKLIWGDQLFNWTIIVSAWTMWRSREEGPVKWIRKDSIVMKKSAWILLSSLDEIAAGSERWWGMCFHDGPQRLRIHMCIIPRPNNFSENKNLPLRGKKKGERAVCIVHTMCNQKPFLVRNETHLLSAAHSWLHCTTFECRPHFHRYLLGSGVSSDETRPWKYPVVYMLGE